MGEDPILAPRPKGVVDPRLLRLGWLIGGGAAEEWLQGETYEYRPNPAVREALEILVEIESRDRKSEKLKLERRGFQVMARQMVLGHDPGFYRSAMDEGKYERVSGEVECPTCRQLYREHPQLPNLPTFHMLCSGEIVKT